MSWPIRMAGKMGETSVKFIKNEIGCRDDMDCCMLSILLTVPSCFNSFWHGVIPTSSFLMIFTLVKLWLSNTYLYK